MTLKPYYQDELATIYHGDCRDVLLTLPQSDLVLTDIPYGVVNRNNNGLRDLSRGGADTITVPIPEIAQMVSNTTYGGYVWCGTEQVSGLRAQLVELGLSTRLCIWEKTNPSPMNCEYIWLSSIECCVYGKKGNAPFNGTYRSPVLRGCSQPETYHPTVKPIWLMATLLKVSTNQGDTVLDPFMGSGTTLRAAKDLQRKSIGIEIDGRYCEIAAKRLSQEVLAL